MSQKEKFLLLIQLIERLRNFGSLDLETSEAMERRK